MADTLPTKITPITAIMMSWATSHLRRLTPIAWSTSSARPRAVWGNRCSNPL